MGLFQQQKQEITKLPNNAAIFFYYLIFEKLLTIINTVYSGYAKETKIFQPAHEDLNRYYTGLLFTFQVFNKRKDFNDISSEIHRPFSSLYKNFNDVIDFWVDIKKMYYKNLADVKQSITQTYDLPPELTVAFQKIDKLLKDHQHQKDLLLNPIINNTDQIYIFGDIVINLSRATLSYKNIIVDITPSNKEFMFLLLLLRNKSTLVEYRHIAKELQLNSFTSDSGNEDVSRAVQDIKKLLSKLLISFGIPKQICINHLSTIRAIKNIGYKMD
jgi:hypothetical protein